MAQSSNKTQVRKHILEMRLGLSRESLYHRSSSVQRRFLNLHEYQRGRRLALYKSFRNEVLTDDIFTAALGEGKEVFFPKVGCVKGRGLDFVRVEGTDDFSTGAYAIAEPKGAEHLDDFSSLSLIVVPGIAFDVAGNRLGYGKGFYDMTLKRVKCCIVALAFNFQVVDSIASESHDVGVHKIVTEDRVIDVAS